MFSPSVVCKHIYSIKVKGQRLLAQNCISIYNNISFKQTRSTFRDTTGNKSTMQNNQIIGGGNQWILFTLIKMKLLRVYCFSLNIMVSYSWGHPIDFHLIKECYICVKFDFLRSGWLACSAYKLFWPGFFVGFFPRWEKVVQIRRPSLWIVVSMQESGSPRLSASGLWKKSVSLMMKKIFYVVQLCLRKS